MTHLDDKAPRLCSYVVVRDTGFAPNPFWGYCTLAACTPNHMGVRLEKGEWLMGHSSASRDRRLIYAMRISAVLPFDAYYGDPTFAKKKPRSASWQERCGDNIYHQVDGRWVQRLNYHHTPADIERDTRHPSVFVSDHFFYFGERAPEVPSEFATLLQWRQGCRWSRDAKTVRGFIEWLERAYSPGGHGLPRDRNTNETCGNEAACRRCE